MCLIKLLKKMLKGFLNFVHNNGYENVHDENNQTVIIKTLKYKMSKYFIFLMAFKS